MKQKGFTLIELIVALGIGVVLLSAIVSSIFLVVHGSIDVRSRMTALADIENAAHWLTRDTIMGQSLDLLEGAPPANTVNITWFDYTGGSGNETAHYAAYTHSGTELRREYDSANNTAIVARRLTEVGFSLDGDLMTVTLISTPERASRSTVNRTYVIEMRAGGE